MKILYATSEAAPFCKTGGLADVAGSLPPALAAEGAQVAVILPMYQRVKEKDDKQRKAYDAMKSIKNKFQYQKKYYN